MISIFKNVSKSASAFLHFARKEAILHIITNCVK